MLFTSVSYAKICFLADPECQKGAQVAGTIESDRLCKDKHTNLIKETEKCEYMSYNKICSDYTGSYYEEIGCMSGYTDIKNEENKEKYDCNSSLKCGRCCLNKDLQEKNNCLNGYISNGSCIPCNHIVSACPSKGHCVDMENNKKCLTSCDSGYMISGSDCIKKPSGNSGGNSLCGMCRGYMCATNNKCYTTSQSCYNNCGRDINSGKTVCVDCSNAGNKFNEQIEFGDYVVK